ncbi:MAG TPA: class II aldolase/adducin family protein [Nocardioidaceae bacterium]|nr:class II aldolase/adducin family protein [Nocardioidaceae bacterium]
MNEHILREQICDIGKNLWNHGMVAANDGNISVRLSADEILCTPTGVSKGYLSHEILPKVNLNGAVLEIADGVSPSSEMKMHLRLYQVSDKVGAVVHAHPIFGTVFAIKGEAIFGKMMPESVVLMPEIPLAPYGTPSTEALADSVEPYVDSHTSCLLENHGALSWGPTLMEAYLNMERLEYTAKITFLARMAGGERNLPESEVEKLIGMRALVGL